jgi:hypothetical protein
MLRVDHTKELDTKATPAETSNTWPERMKGRAIHIQVHPINV